MRKQYPNRVFDELLVLQCQAGDTKALELLIRRWHKRIVAYAYQITRNTEASKDVAQEAWVVVVERLFKLKDPSKFGSWLLSITHNKSVDWINQMKKRREVQEFKATTEQETEESNAQLSAMRSAMQELSSDHRLILRLFYLEGLTINEITEVLNLSKGTVKSRLFYARNALKNKIK